MRRYIFFTFSLIYVMSVVRGQDISSSGPIVLPLAGQTAYSGSGTVKITSSTSVYLGPGSTLSPYVSITISNILPPPAAPSNPSADADKNWVYVRTYDESGNELSATKQFFDNNGKATQLQTMNETAG